MTQTPTGYSKAQIVLHWLVALLIIFQIVGHESMVAAWDAIRDDKRIFGFDLYLARAHVVSGIVIWLFAAWRLYLRFTRGAPVPPESEHPALQFLANLVHVLLYILLLTMPVSGAVAWFLGAEGAAYAHSLARFVLLPALLLHIAGALAHHYWFKTDVLRRMMRPQA